MTVVQLPMSQPRTREFLDKLEGRFNEAAGLAKAINLLAQTVDGDGWLQDALHHVSEALIDRLRLLEDERAAVWRDLKAP